MPKITQQFGGPTGTITQASGPRSVLLKQLIKSFSCQPCAHPNSSCQASRDQRSHSLPRFAAGTAVSKWHLTNSTQGLVEPVACDHCTQPCLHWVGGWTEHVPTPRVQASQQQAYAASHAPSLTAAAGPGGNWTAQGHTVTPRLHTAPAQPFPL